MRKSQLFVCFTLLFVLLCATTQARVIANIPNSTILPPRTLLPIKVQSHNVNVTIKNGVAVTTLESVFYNPNHRVLEGTYLLALPKGASVANFSLWIDGKEMPAELLDANKARNLYISIVRRMIDPALLEFVGRETFKMRIFPLPARGSRKIKLTYQQILPTEGNLTRYEYPLTAVGNSHDDTIGQLSWNIKISGKTPIKSIFSPTHKIKVEKQTNNATVNFSGNNIQTNRDFVLYISNSKKNVDLSFIPFRKGSQKGFFLMMLSPKAKVSEKEINPKDVVFIIDTSGSMVGDNMEQAKSALKYCLHQLRPQDKFNIVPFSTEASPYKDNLLDASKANIKEAVDFVEEEIYARGGTNIEEALGYALEMAPKTGQRPYMVILLTDGKPTIGVTEPKEIIAKVQKAKLKNLRLFTFGIGERLNTKLLDRLAEENRGAREYVGAKEDIEIKISNFVDKISSPVLSNIQIRFPSAQGLRVTEVYPRQFPDLFKGSRLMLLGRYKGHGDQAIRIKGMIGGKAKEFVYEVVFPEKSLENRHVPRLWAVRKVGFLLDQIRLNGDNPELKKEVIRLAKKYGIVTPYTSYLVIEDTPTITRPTPIIRRRQPGVWRPSAPEENDDVDREMKQDSGGEAIKTSKKLRDMKTAEAAYNDKGTKNGGTKMLRKIAYKTFYKKGKVWYDSESLSVKAKKLQKIRVRYLGQQYIKLLQKNPEMGEFLAIGANVVIVWQDKIYEIYNK